MKQKNIIYGVVLTLASSIFVAGCGGGSAAAPVISSTPVNVSLPANGGAATATANGASALYINDGLTTTTNSWTGVATNDSVTVTFNKVYSVSKFTLYLNATNTIDTKIQVSADGTTYSDLTLLSGTCSSVTIGSGKIDCTFITNRNLKAMRVVILNTAAPSNIQLYELEATGL